MTNRPGVPDHAAPDYEVYPEGKTEPKVKAATAGAGAGAVVSGFIVWLLDEILWNGDQQPDVPLPVLLFVGLTVTSALTFFSGYFARHVNR